MQQLVAELFLLVLHVLLLGFGICQLPLLALRPCLHLGNRRLCLFRCLMRSLSDFSQMSADPSECLYIFCRNSQFLKVDFVFSIRDVIDGDLFAVGVTNVALCHNAKVQRCRDLHQSSVVSLLLWCHVMCWDELRVGTKNYWWKVPSGLEKHQNSLDEGTKETQEPQRHLWNSL